MSDIQPPAVAAHDPHGQSPPSAVLPRIGNMLRTAHLWWHRVRPTTAADLEDTWAHCTTWGEAAQVLSHVSSWSFDLAREAMVRRVPRCWPEIATLAAEHPLAARAFLQR